MKEKLRKIKDSILKYINRKDAKKKGLLKEILEIIEKNEKNILRLEELFKATPDISTKTFIWIIRKIKELDKILFFLKRFEDGCELAILLSRVKGMKEIKKGVIAGKGKLGRVFRRNNLVLKDLIDELLIYRKFYDSGETKKMIKSLKKVLKSIKKRKKWYNEKKFKEGSKYVKELKKLIEFMEDERKIENFLEKFLEFLEKYYKTKEELHKKIKGVIKKGRLLNKVKKVKRKKISPETEAIVLGRIRRYRIKILLNLRRFKKILKEELKNIKEIKLKNKELNKKFKNVFEAKESLKKFLQRTIAYFDKMKIEEKHKEEEKEEEKPLEKISKDIMEILISIYEISEEIKRIFKIKDMKKLLKVSISRQEAFEALNRIIEKDKERIDEINEKIREALREIERIKEFIEKSTTKERVNEIKSFVNKTRKEIKKKKMEILFEKRIHYKLYKEMFFKILRRVLKVKVNTKEDYKKLKVEMKEIKEVTKASEKMVEDAGNSIIKLKEKFLREIKDISKDILDFLDSLREMLEDMVETEDIKAEYGEKLFSGFLEYILSYEEALRTKFKKVLERISKLMKIREETVENILKKYLEKIESIEIETPKKKKSPDAYKIIAKASEGVTKLLERETKNAEDLTEVILEMLSNSKILGKEIKENKEIVKKTIKNLAVLSKIIKKLFKVKKRKKKKIRLPKISLPLFR